MKRVVLILVVATVAALFVNGAAFADPVNNPQQITVTYTCEGGEQVELVNTFPLAGPEAMHEVGTRSIWEPMAGMRRFTNLETGEVIEVQGEVPGQVEHNDLVRCTATYTFDDRIEGSFRVEDTQFFLVTPQGGQESAVTTIAALLVVGPASADPVQNPHNATITYTCEGDEEVTFVMNPFRAIIPRHEVGDNSIWVAMDVTRRFTDLETGEVLEVGGHVPGQVEHNDLVRCTATFTFEGVLVEDTTFFLVTPQGGQD
jgi:hypothetical protein